MQEYVTAPLFDEPLVPGGTLARIQTAAFPRVRYMGSKYKVIPALVDVFSSLSFDTALDAFSGSGVVGYALKAMGKTVTTNDFLNFPTTIARATVENADTHLDEADVARILSPAPNAPHFIRRTFNGLYFPSDDLDFLDAAWAHVDLLPPYKRDLALAALCLAAARKQPRGVFTVTDFRYDDGRRHLRASLRDLFCEAVTQYNAVVFDNERPNHALCGDVFDVDPNGLDLVYLDPPYAPPRDDNDYIKRYHFLEGLSLYWRGQRIMENTITKKLEKRYTPFGSKRTIVDALRRTFHHFRQSTIVLSYSSNSVPDRDEIYRLLAEEKSHVDVIAIPHRYSFGTHAAAERRQVDEYIFVAR
jgi:adenine-specific DNA-methyltransferase